MLSIGLDIGTTGICGILIDSADGSIIKTDCRPNSFFVQTDKAFERIQNADGIFNTVNDILENLFCDGVKCIGITGQMHGIVYLDKNGMLLSPLYTWQDMRGALPYKDGTYASNLGIAAGYGLATHYYNQLNGLVDENAAVICTIHDYVAMKISGLNSPVVHSSDAASFGRYNPENNTFDYSDGLLPDTVKASKIIGEYKGAAVCTAIGDNQASYIGSAKNGAPLVNVGTGSQVTVYSDSYKQVKGLETRPLDDGKYILVGCAICGGSSFALLEGFFASVCEMAGMTRENLYKKMDAMLASSLDTTMVFDTKFSGTRENPNERAIIKNISADNFTAKDMTVALLNGIAGELYDFYRNCESKTDLLIGSGNGIRKNPALCKTFEKLFSSTLLIPYHNEEAAFGAALTALKAVGEFESIQQAQNIIHYL